MIRTLAVAASALILSAGLVSAQAAPRHRAHAKPHAGVHHASMRHGTVARGRDGESSTVDQLNAQSLNAARGGAPAAR